MKHVKKRYQVQNWPQYEEGLRNRGSLTVWLGMVEGNLDHWDEPQGYRIKDGAKSITYKTGLTVYSEIDLLARSTAWKTNVNS